MRLVLQYKHFCSSIVSQKSISLHKHCCHRPQCFVWMLFSVHYYTVHYGLTLEYSSKHFGDIYGCTCIQHRWFMLYSLSGAWTKDIRLMVCFITALNTWQQWISDKNIQLKIVITIHNFVGKRFGVKKSTKKRRRRSRRGVDGAERKGCSF